MMSVSQLSNSTYGNTTERWQSQTIYLQIIQSRFFNCQNDVCQIQNKHFYCHNIDCGSQKVDFGNQKLFKKQTNLHSGLLPIQCGEAMTGKLSEIKFCLQNRSNLIPSYQQHHEKPAQCKFENKSAGQLPSHCTADQHVCFPYINRTIPLLLKFKKIKSDHFFYGCRAWFVPHLVRTPE